MIIIVTTIACFTCGAIGYFVGWITTADRLDRRAEPEITEERPSTFPAQEAADFWENVQWDTGPRHARSSPRVTAGGGFPALPAAQAPLRELVQPGRTTDFIDKVRADTDRWLAARGLGDAT